MPIPLVAGVGFGLKALGGIIGGARARKAERRAAELERVRRAEMNELKEAYSNIDTSNPFLGMGNQFSRARNVYSGVENVYQGMENTMEDLTINQQQAQFEAQQFSQSQANILSNLKGAAGGSGVAALAQSLAQQGQLRAQQASASIGAQESVNQRLAAQQAGRIQSLQMGEQSRLQGLTLGEASSMQTRRLSEDARLQDMRRQGEIISRQQQRDQTGTLLGMSQMEVGTARQERMAHAKQKADSFASIGSTAGDFLSAGIGSGWF